jgi:hypothetical protein
MTPSIVTTLTGEKELPVVVQTTSFKLYPNPTSGNFTIEHSGDRIYDKVNVELYGMRGDKLMTGELIGEKKHEFRTLDLPPGVYIVKVLAEGYAETFKLVKTR